jgi:6-phosphogluconolactonase (cycloisomerase 2 family)
MAIRNAVAWLAGALICGVAWGQKPVLTLERVIPLPGVEGRIDHLAADADGRRVFLAALGNGTIEVVDVAQGQRVGEIKELKEPQGLFYFPRNHTLYVATGGDGMVRVYNGHTLAFAGSMTLGNDADNIRFDHQTDTLMVGYGDGAIAFLPMNLQGGVEAEVKLPAHPESFQVSSDGSHLIVNLPHDQSIAWVDLAPLRVASKWTHLDAQSNFPMDVDRKNRRVFVACRAPAQLLELDEATGTVLQRMNTVDDADDLFFDEERNRLYVIGGEGFVDVVDVAKGGKMTPIGRVQTAGGARTGLLIPAWNKLVVAAPHRGTDPARLLVYALP